MPFIFSSRLRVGALTLMASLLWGCGIRKQAPTTGKEPAKTITSSNRAEIEAAIQEQSQSWTAIKAKLAGELRTGDKTLSARIHLQAARGQGIRLSVHYLLFEVARIWFSPSEVTFVDLINGGYAQEPYNKFGERLGITIDYPQIESLFMGAVFAPGKGASSQDLRSMAFHYIEKHGPQLVGQVLGHTYAFLLTHEATLRKIVLAKKGGETTFEAEYRSEGVARTLPVLSTPAIAEYRIYPPSKQANPRERGALLLEWQSVQMLPDASELALEPIIKPKYERIDLGRLIKALNR